MAMFHSKVQRYTEPNRFCTPFFKHLGVGKWLKEKSGSKKYGGWVDPYFLVAKNLNMF